MRVFLAGASGYLAAAVAWSPLEAGHEVLRLARPDATGRRPSATGVEPPHPAQLATTSSTAARTCSRATWRGTPDISRES